ncbi:MAG: DUF2203 domain-containing protein [Actinomycetota bacterium]
MSEEVRFSVEDANAAVPHLRELLPRVREARQGLIASSRRISEDVAGDGGGVAGSDWFRHQQVLKEAVEDLARRGILLRDPESGLVDFPSERDGRTVYLCWRLDDPAGVEYFHDESAGYRGREPL